MNVYIGARIPKELHARILEIREDNRKTTGIEPSVSEVVKMLLEKATAAVRKPR